MYIEIGVDGKTTRYYVSEGDEWRTLRSLKYMIEGGPEYYVVLWNMLAALAPEERSVKEAAKMLGIAPKTIYERARKYPALAHLLGRKENARPEQVQHYALEGQKTIHQQE